MTEETKKKISESLKTSERNKAAVEKKKRRIIKKCPVCGKNFESKVSAPHIFCSPACYREDAKTGYNFCKKPRRDMAREQSSGYKSIKGWYKGIWCDSSWELAYVLYCTDNKIPIERYSDYYDYVDFQDRPRRYYPDFLIEHEKLIEIKGRRDQNTELKLRAVTDKSIEIIDREKIQKYIDYAKDTYGNFISLYEHSFLQIKKCLHCGKDLQIDLNWTSRYKVAKYCSNHCATQAQKGSHRPCSPETREKIRLSWIKRKEKMKKGYKYDK